MIMKSSHSARKFKLKARHGNTRVESKPSPRAAEKIERVPPKKGKRK